MSFSKPLISLPKSIQTPIDQVITSSRKTFEAAAKWCGRHVTAEHVGVAAILGSGAIGGVIGSSSNAAFIGALRGAALGGATWFSLLAARGESHKLSTEFRTAVVALLVMGAMGPMRGSSVPENNPAMPNTTTTNSGEPSVVIPSDSHSAFVNATIPENALNATTHNYSAVFSTPIQHLTNMTAELDSIEDFVLPVNSTMGSIANETFLQEIGADTLPTIAHNLTETVVNSTIAEPSSVIVANLPLQTVANDSLVEEDQAMLATLASNSSVTMDNVPVESHANVSAPAIVVADAPVPETVASDASNALVVVKSLTAAPNDSSAAAVVDNITTASKNPSEQMEKAPTTLLPEAKQESLPSNSSTDVEADVCIEVEHGN